MRVYVRTQPQRAVLFATNTFVLTFRYMESAEQRATANVEFHPRRDVDLGSCSPLSVNCLGCLGLINVGDDVFVAIITERSKAGMPTPKLTVWGVHAVHFIPLRREIYLTDENEHPCAALQKFFGGGGFYYSSDFDLTATIQGGDRTKRGSSSAADPSHMWNQFMIKGLNTFRGRLTIEDQQAIDESGFLTSLIRGYVGTIPVHLDQHSKLSGTLTVISRQSWLRAGTRYNSRGIDDDGNVANFVETETVLWLRNGLQFGYLQLRGSVPLFWEQDPQLLTAKITLTRSMEATEPALRKHFDNLVDRFGSVHIVDLLGSYTGSRGSTGPGAGIGPTLSSTSVSGTPASSGASISSFASSGSDASGLHTNRGVGPATEADVSLRYQTLAERVPGIQYTHFDFHKEVAGIGYSAASKLIDRIQDSMLEFGFYSYNPLTGSTETEQIGLFRVNCLDCLDRTNLVQQLISKDALDLFLDYHQLYPSADLWNAHATLWADNGDQLSQNYTGTGALKSSYTRSGRMNLAGALSDVTKSVSRLYINNFVDKSRQSAIEEILGKSEGQVPVTIYDPINDHVRQEMKQREQEFQSERQISIFAGTFNVNGKLLDPYQEDISKWLFPASIVNSGHYPDLYMLGFQELVELTTSQILSVDPSRKMYWEEQVGQCLNSRDERYVLLRSGQLVGTAIMLFVKRSEMKNVTEVEGTSKKTALGGITGNKGGVAVGLRYASTRFMLINSHLAAGMHNVEDRHNEYKLLSAGLRLAGGRRVKDADVVIWLGDFNYRVDLPNDTVRKMMEHKTRDETISRLLDYDQLIYQMERGETFPYYNEQKITFMPTYKFDPGTSTYDTSDKQRVPAWTDRILTKGTRIKHREYKSVPQIRFSDHRPVYGLFDVTVSVVDEKRADQIYSQLYNRRRDSLMESAGHLLTGHINNKGALAESNLPHPSTNAKKWWAGEGLPTKVPIVLPRPGMVLNPEKINPFGSPLEDFVPKPSPPPPRDSPPSNSDQHLQPPPPPPRIPSSTHVSHRPNSISPASSVPSLMDSPVATVKQPPRVPVRKPVSGASSVKSERSMQSMHSARSQGSDGSLIDADHGGDMSSYKSLI